MNTYQKIFLVAVLVIIFSVLLFYLYKSNNTDSKVIETQTVSSDVPENKILEEYFPSRVELYINNNKFEVSVAQTKAELQQGLSNTPLLPEGVVKLFVFASYDWWGIWMKDMHYPIDILWLDSAGVVVDIEESATPDSYPTVFRPNKPAWYVIETNAGLAEEEDIQIGDQISLPSEL